MSFINKFFKRDNSINVEENFSNDLLLKSLIQGNTLSKEKAMSIPAFSSSVDKVSNLVAMLPIKFYKITNDNDHQKVTEILDDERIKLLNLDTNDTLDPFQLKKAITRDYLISKGAYVYIEKARDGSYKSLKYVNSDNVSIITNNEPIHKDAKYLINAKQYEIYEFLTVIRNTVNGVSGTSVVYEVAKSLETSLTTIMYELGLVQKGGGKKGFLTSNKKLSDDAIDKLKKAWSQYYDNSQENVIILNEGLEFKEGANSSVELQINERKKTLNSDIYDLFHISSSYDDTVKNAVIPIISAIESALNKTLLRESEKGSFYFAFDTKKITRGSLKERYESYKLASETGWMTANEIRLEEDYDDIPGLDVIKMNLANVLYDSKNKTYYTPNTGKVVSSLSGKEVNENENRNKRK